MTDRLAWTVLAAVVLDVLLTPPGASWPNLAVAVAGCLAGWVLIREDVPELSDWSVALDALRKPVPSRPDPSLRERSR